MNQWRCNGINYETGKRCTITACGSGGAIGLRAIGWWFEPGHEVRCPAHRPDAHGACREAYRMAGDALGPDPCSSCTADEEAERFQLALAKVLRLEISPRDVTSRELVEAARIRETPPPPRVVSVWRFRNGMIAVCDENGNQLSHLQGPDTPELRAVLAPLITHETSVNGYYDTEPQSLEDWQLEWAGRAKPQSNPEGSE